MLTIRAEQMAAFQPVAERDFENRLMKFIRDHLNETEVRLTEGEVTVAQIPDETLAEMARNGVARARQYGLTWELTLVGFVILMFTEAPNFDSHPLIRRVLMDDSIEANQRLDRLDERITEQNWDAVEEAYDPAAWNLNSNE
jgi:hypothetical protein